MQLIQFSTVSIAYLTQAILGIWITIYLIRKPQKTRESWLLLAFYAAFSLNVVSQFWANSGSGSWVFVFPAMYPALFMLELYPLVLFAYYFLENPFPRESKIVSVVGGIIVLVTSVYTAYQIIAFGPNHRTPFGLFIILSSVVLLWTVLVFARKTIIFANYIGRLEPLLTRPTTIVGWMRYIPVNVLAGLSKLVRPDGRTARGNRAFLIIVLFWVLIGVVGSLSVLGNFPEQLLLIISLIGMLVFISGFVLVYTNYSGEPTSFQVKLVGVSLVTMLAALGMLSLRAYTLDELASESGLQSPEGMSLLMAPAEDGTYLISPDETSVSSDMPERPLMLSRNGSAPVELGFDFPFGGRTYDSAFVNENGFVSFGDSVSFDLNPMYLNNGPVFNEVFYNHVPKISPLFFDFDIETNAGITYVNDADRFSVWWTTDETHEEELTRVGLSLFESGAIQFDYGRIGTPIFNLLTGVHPGGEVTPVETTSFGSLSDAVSVSRNAVAVEDYRAIFKSYQHSKVANYFEMIVWTALFILVVFPMFFKANLIDPLKSLLQGVRRVNDGDLEVEVPVYMKDEIGLLASNFNQMTESLKKAHADLEEYADQLEIKVADRTFELRSSLQELKRTQAQLIHAEKMASLGLMTTGIAHEITNPLNFVTNFAEVNVELLTELQTALENGAEPAEISELLTDMRNSAEEIAKHGLRADAIVKNMMLHASTSSGRREPVEVHRLLDESIAIAVHSMSEESGALETTFEKDYDQALEMLDVLPQELGRAFVNIVANALKATYKKAQNDGEYIPVITIKTRSEDGMARITIRDNGVGIPANIQDKIFQPFFTTSSGTENVGLGLSISYDIVVDGHGGSFELESSEGEFAEFTIILPIHAERGVSA